MGLTLFCKIFPTFHDVMATMIIDNVKSIARHYGEGELLHMSVPLTNSCVPSPPLSHRYVVGSFNMCMITLLIGGL